MKKVIYSFGLLAAMLMTACGNEDEPGRIDMPEGGVHTRLTLSLPSDGSRSQTITPGDDTNSDAGYEVGQDEENKINSVFVVVAKKAEGATTDAPENFKFIAAAQADATGIEETDNQSRPKFTVKFQSEELINNAEKEVYIFAYCNPTTQVINKIGELKVGDTFADVSRETVENSTIWAPNSFLMTNRDLSKTELPTVAEMEKADRHNPVDLGMVKVQRVAARFDFAQTTVKDETKINYYPVANAADETKTEGYVEILGMSLFNMSKSAYYLPIMATDKDWTNLSLCQRESTNNWVVSTNKDFKLGYKGEDASNYFYFPTSVEGFMPSSMNYTALSSLNKDDNDENWTGGTGSNYKIWRYSVENTIPGIDEQKHGITTGVLFKAKLSAKEGSELATMLASGHVLYAFDGHIYGDKAQLEAAVEKAPTTTLSLIYQESFKEGVALDENGDLLETIPDGFTIYRPDANTGEYYCYYYYYNRHNDNGANMTMGQMEFAVVRNNVYKLKINSISDFGHPGDPKDDPDPENPDDPDESPKTYFKLDVQVLPWVVRVNNLDL